MPDAARPLVCHLARAPSNIALVKYMGKTDAALNLAENPSLSMTLDRLCSWAELRLERGDGRGKKSWVPELPVGALPLQVPLSAPVLKEAAVTRILNHVDRVQRALPALAAPFGIPLLPGFESADLSLRTANTFPTASGIASSASSFAAVTLVTAMAAVSEERFARVWEAEAGFRAALAKISRQGSGSSCRSFEGPWVLWDGDAVESVPSRLPALSHFVLVVSSEAKSVSSSEAHLRVKTSPLWEGRAARAAERAYRLRQALAAGDVPAVSRLAWTEAWEMHSLFHTSREPFTYWEPATVEALKWLSGELQTSTAPPIITMDAGPNIHLTCERAQAEAWRAKLRARFPAVTILEDRPGKGAQPVRSPT